MGELFEGKTINFSQTPTPNTLPTGDNYFGTLTDDIKKDVQSCLVVSWKKASGDDSKISGIFTWAWTFVNKDKAFINFNVANAQQEDKKIKVTGGFYLLEKKADNQEWEIKYQKEEEAGKDIGASDFETKFPKNGLDTPSEAENKNYWGFISKKEDVDKVTKLDTANTSTPTLKKWVWKWEDNGQKELFKWSSNLKSWWEGIYKDNSNTFDLEKQLTSFQSGSWTLKTPQQ